MTRFQSQSAIHGCMRATGSRMAARADPRVAMVRTVPGTTSEARLNSGQRQIIPDGTLVCRPKLSVVGETSESRIICRRPD